MSIAYQCAPDRDDRRIGRHHPFIIRLNQLTELSDADLRSLDDLIHVDTLVKRRSELIIEGYEYRKLCIVEDGYAARYKLLRNGRRQVINVVLPGDVIGIPGSFLQKAHYSVVAISDLRLQVCSIMDFINLCYRRPQFALALSWLAIQEAVSYGEHIVDVGRRTPLERLAHFLMEFYTRLSLVGRARGLTFELPFSQELMADTLGLSVPHLNRMLARLRTDRLISLSGRQVRIDDVDSLRTMAHFQPPDLARIPPPRSAFASRRQFQHAKQEG
jgi:CRP-like cAMP-binding protein